MRPQERSDKSTFINFLLVFFEPEAKSWRGEQPLRKVFWSYGVLVSNSIGVIYILSMYGDHIVLQQILLPCIAAYTLWLLVSIWRSSGRTTNANWGTLARYLAIVWAGNTILVLSFLQLELIERYIHDSAGP